MKLPSLEPDRIRSWLQQEVDWPDGVQLRDVRLNRLWAGRKESLTFEFALDLLCGGTQRTCLLQGGSAVDTPPHPHVRARVSRHGLKGLRLTSDELGLWCCTPDRDRKLPIVRALMDDRRAASVLAATAAAPLLSLDGHGQEVRCEIVAYRAGKRCSLLASSSDSRSSGDLFVKVLRRTPASEQVQAWKKLPAYLDERSQGRIRAPAIVDYDSDNRMLITAAVTRTAKPLGTEPEAIAAAAKSLAILHNLPAMTMLKTHTPADELQTACRWVGVLRGLGQDRYARLSELAAKLSGLVNTVEETGTTIIHRDFFADQLLQDGDTLWMVDFDTLCLGHPELDVATFVAHLFLDKLSAGAKVAEITRKAASFLDTYRENGGKFSEVRSRFYLPCAFSRLGAIHSTRGVSAQVVDGLWKLAEDHLSGHHDWTGRC